MDRGEGVRLTLDGTRLTATVIPRANHRRTPPLLSELSGKRIRVGCSTSFRPRRSKPVLRIERWPKGATSASFDLKRDISRRARWCLIESTGKHGGGDLAFVSFLHGEPKRLLAKGRGPSGERWRLSAWRSDRLEPCVRLRVADLGADRCFSDYAEIEAELAVGLLTPSCPGDTFVLGATARSAATVTSTLEDGTTANAALYSRPIGSRARARYYLIVLPGLASVVSVEARDGSGRVIGRERIAADTWMRPCGQVVPN